MIVGDLNPARMVKQIHKRGYFVAPSWRTEKARDKIQGMTLNEENLYWKIYREYGSCLAAIYNSEIDFRVILADKDGDAALFRQMGLLGFSAHVFDCEIPLHFSTYPRSLLTVLNDTILVNPRQAAIEPETEKMMQYSLYGDGGVILSSFSQKKVLISSLTENEDGTIVSVEIPKEFIQKGFQVGFIPNCAYKRISLTGKILEGEYLSRYTDFNTCLLEGCDEKLYLLVDERIETVYLENGELFRSDTKESLDKIERVCEAMDITMVPVDVSILSELNLLQLEDGRVLMTSGNDILFETIEHIVGEGKVNQTEKPLLILSLFGEGGIRSITNYFPDFLVKKIVLKEPSKIEALIKKIF